MKKHRWPRPPFVLGLILGPIVEDSFHKSMALWGPLFLLRPGALILLALMVGSFAVYMVRTRRGGRKIQEPQGVG